jgi:hemoglobin/transferrin/lactoferrin receptor protein
MIRSESVNAFSFNLDLDKLLSEKVNISYGVEYLFNRVGSEGISYDVESNDIQTIASRYPDGSTWSSLASYLSLKYKPNNRFTFQSGVRYNAISINSDLSANSQFYPLPFLNASLDTSAMSATAGFSWEQNEIFLWKLNTTTAFRAPNIDDIGKIFDSQPGYVVLPNSSLDPEYAYGCELGLNININNSVLLDISSYYTHLDNAITRDLISINGVSEIFYDGELCQTQAVQNSSEARIYGFEAGIKAILSNSFEITSQYSLTKGRQKNNQNFDTPVRHVAPEFGNIHLIWKGDKISLDGFLNYNGILRHEDISHELSNHLFAQDQNGYPYSPAWYTLNLRTRFKFSDTLSFIGSIENILNEGYRPFASGVSAPGANFIFAISYND